MPTELLNYDISVFNGLPLVEPLEKHVRSTGLLETALTVLYPVFIKHDLWRNFGICIVHKHWDLAKSEVPMQRIIVDSPSEKVYTTSPCSDVPEFFAPAIFGVHQDELWALEFSTDQFVIDAFAELKSKPEFVRDFCQIVNSNGLADCFGLIVVKPLSDNSLILLETTEGRVSTLREVDPAEALSSGKNIETSWSFAPDIQGRACKTKCLSACTVGDTHQHSHSTYHDPAGDVDPLKAPYTKKDDKKDDKGDEKR